MKDARVQPHLIHPTALDAIVHLTIVGHSRGGWKAIPTIVPTHLDELWISHDLLTSTPDSALRVLSQDEFQGIRDMECTMISVDSETGQPKVIIQGYRGTSVSSLQSNATYGTDSTTQRRICYEIDWKPDVEFLTKPELYQLCVHSELQQQNVEKYSATMSIAELVCEYFLKRAQNAVQENGGLPEGTSAHFHRYVDWMTSQLSAPECQRRLASPEGKRLFDDEVYRSKIFERLKLNGTDGEMVLTVGHNLPQILFGEVDALALLFDGDLVADFYQSGWLDANHAQLASYMDLLAHKNSDLRILEVGAGTGSATGHILDTLGSHGLDMEHGTPRFTNYTYTDISAVFFESARDRFQEYGDRVVFKTLDISADPAAQGFPDGSFDVVIASNVLHATPDLGRTVEHVRQLLRPGGKLLIMEATRPSYTSLGFGFGTLPGWWMAQEPERSLSPLLTNAQWHDKLLAHGFSGTALAMGDVEGTDPSFSVIISESVSVPTANGLPQPFGHSTFLIADYADPRQQKVASLIAARLYSASQSCAIISPSAILSSTLSHSACIFLPELTRSFLGDMARDDFDNVKSLLTQASLVLWVTSQGGEKIQDPRADIVADLSRSLCSERPDMRFCTLALEQSEPVAVVETVCHVFEKLIALSPDEAYEADYIERMGQLHIGRLVEANFLNKRIYLENGSQEPQLESFQRAEDPNRGLSLAIGSAGLLDTLHFVQDKARSNDLMPRDVEIRVQASGLNFKDVMVAMGQLPDPNIGVECAGIVSRVGSGVDNVQVGDRVTCTTKNGSFQTFARATSDVVAKIPDGMSFTQAASFPIAFLTAYYALVEVARIQPNETVLIHAGAGGVGQAAIQIAHTLGACIFATVSTDAKKQLLIQEYGISSEHIFSSRKLSFARGIKRLTHGTGVDVVLNSLAGDSLRETWQCLAPLGRFVEIGKRDIVTNGGLPMSGFGNNRLFAAVDLVVLTELKPSFVGDMLRKLLRMANEGVLKPPFPLHIKPVSKLENAFRGLQSGKLAGKLIVEMGPDNLVPVGN